MMDDTFLHLLFPPTFQSLSRIINYMLLLASSCFSCVFFCGVFAGHLLSFKILVSVDTAWEPFPKTLLQIFYEKWAFHKTNQRPTVVHSIR